MISFFQTQCLPYACAIDHVWTLCPYGLEPNATKKVPNFDCFAKFLGHPFPEQHLFPMEAFVIDGSNTTKLVHDENGPSPSPPSLNVVPNLNAVLLFGRQKRIVWRWMLVQCEPSIHYLPVLYAKWTKWKQLPSRTERVPNLRPMEFVITQKITLPFIRRACDPWIHVDDKVSSELRGIVKKTKPSTQHQRSGSQLRVATLL